MPFVSRAQQRWGHTKDGEKALGGPAAVQEWDSATNETNLPMRKMMGLDQKTEAPKPKRRGQSGF